MDEPVDKPWDDSLILKISLAQSFDEAQQCLIEEGEKDGNQ
ncbi:MAG TPA: hypothetical protein VKB35_10325 [Ktedonobacteraceae bacterium]|nr:hypothetical protein [Ktedonobacteraceae bacterium]